MLSDRNNVSSTKTHRSLNRALALLDGEYGLPCPASFPERLSTYREILATWNPYAGLMSPKALDEAFYDHVADSLSLAPYVMAALDEDIGYLDIGSGGGLPALPLCLYLGDVATCLVERQERKAAFLHKARSGLELNAVHVIHGSFPNEVQPAQPVVVTARAIERPRQFLRDIGLYLESKSSFLWQRGWEDQEVPKGLCVEPIDDAFQAEGIRRGRLSRVTKDGGI